MALPISYHWRNLFVRKTTNLLTILVIAAVVGVLCYMLGLAAAVKRSLAVANDPRKIIVIRNGATAESNSAIGMEDYNKLAQIEAIERDSKGVLLESPEVITIVQCKRKRDAGETSTNVSVRGVTESAFTVHDGPKIVRGRNFVPGQTEVIVGVTAAKQFAGLEIGDMVQLGYGGDRGYQVVGHFDARGGPMESEIWAYLPMLQNSFKRDMYSSVALRLKEQADVAGVVKQIKDPAIDMNGQTEEEYWAAQAKTANVYLSVAYALIGVMTIAAMFAIANTMFASVAGRTREIAMLRTIGFKGRQILTGFLIEAVMLSLLGGLVGIGLCQLWLTWIGNQKDIYGSGTFTTLAFEIRLTPMIAAVALAGVSAIGAIGAVWPALRAARLQAITALRVA